MFWQDFRYALRVMRKNSGFTLLAVSTLALGIGANSAIFSLVNSVLLRPLPYYDPERLVVLRQEAPPAGLTEMRFSLAEFRDLEAEARSFDALLEYQSEPFVLMLAEHSVRVQAGVVSADFFDQLGVAPLIGRSLRPTDNEPGAEPVLLLTHSFWQREFGGDPAILGSTLRLSGASHGRDTAYSLAGILPPFLQVPDENDIYMPAAASPFRAAQLSPTSRSSRRIQVFGRMKPGVSLEEARTDLASIAQNWMREHPEVYPKENGHQITALRLQDQMTGTARPTLLFLMGTVGLVLLLACANVANLTLVSQLRREKEISVRVALGATRRRLLCQLLTESTLLSLMGGAAGLLLASFGLELLVAFIGRLTPRAAEVSIDSSALLFTLILSLVTGILFGLIPALKLRRDTALTLHEWSARSSTPRSVRLRHGLVLAQVSICLILLIGTSLFVRTLINFHAVDPGFDPRNVWSARITFNPTQFGDEGQQVLLFERIVERVRALPGVTDSSVTLAIPLAQSRPFFRNLLVENRTPEEGRSTPQADMRVAGPGYFRTLGIRLIRGRTFLEQDAPGAPAVAVINRSMAEEYWRDREAVGSRVSLDGGQSWIRIVGVVADVKQLGLDRGATHEIYRPYAQFPVGNLLLVRTSGGRQNMAASLRSAVAEVDSRLPVDNIRTLDQIRSESFASPRMTTLLVGLFAALAFLISVIGISGITSLFVSERTREFGIRMALGATPKLVLRMVLRQSIRPILYGLLIGIAGAAVLMRLFSGLLFQVQPTDPIGFGVAAAVFLLAASVASFLPARRATQVDPAVALHHE